MADRLANAGLIDQVRDDFGIELTSLSPVAGGADTAAAVWRATAADGASYAMKLSHADMTAGLLATAHLATRAVRGVPAPLCARSGQLWSAHDGAQLALTPWVAGRRGIEHGMDADGWRCFGAVMAAVHSVDVPSRLGAALPVEDYVPVALPAVRALAARLRDGSVSRSADVGGDADDLTRAVIADWLAAADRIATLGERAETLGRDLRRRQVPNVLSHGDAHTGNLMIDEDGQVWLVDWDGVALAPRERDLMFVIGGVLADAPVSQQQMSWFFDGYGPTDVDPMLLSYYRCGRALEDVGGWSAVVLDDRGYPPADRAEALAIFRGLLSPDGIVELALHRG